MLGGSANGAAPGVTLVPAGVLDCKGNGSVSQLLAGIEWVTANAVRPATAIVSATAPGSDALDEAVQRAIASGIVFVVAAGNDATDACASSPARVPEAITVAASDQHDSHALFSNFGACIDLFAPGVDIPSIAEPDTTVSGTSIAAGYAAGAAARFLEHEPDASAETVAGALVENATPGVVTNVPEGTPDLLLSTTFLDNAVPSEPTTTTTVTPTTTVPPATVPSTTPPTAPASGETAPLLPTSENATALAVPTGRGVSAFVRGVDGQLWWRQQTSGGWEAWQSFGGSIVGEPSVVSTSSGVYVFARGTDNALWWQRHDGTKWSGWQSFGGIVTEDPAAVTNGSEIYVFVRGVDNGLYWRRFGTSWSDWRGGGGNLRSAPVATVDSTGFHVFANGGGHLWWQRINGDSGTGWTWLERTLHGEPAAAVDSSGVSVFIRGVDSALHRRRLSGGNWQTWQNFGGTLLASPTAVGHRQRAPRVRPGPRQRGVSPAGHRQRIHRLVAPRWMGQCTLCNTRRVRHHPVRSRRRLALCQDLRAPTGPPGAHSAAPSAPRLSPSPRPKSRSQHQRRLRLPWVRG